MELKLGTKVKPIRKSIGLSWNGFRKVCKDEFLIFTGYLDSEKRVLTCEGLRWRTKGEYGGIRANFDFLLSDVEVITERDVKVITERKEYPRFFLYKDGGDKFGETKMTKYAIGDRVKVNFEGLNSAGQVVDVLWGNIYPNVYMVDLDKAITVQGVATSCRHTFLEEFLSPEPKRFFIGQHEVTKDGNRLKVGCQGITHEEFNKCATLMGWNLS